MIDAPRCNLCAHFERAPTPSIKGSVPVFRGECRRRAPQPLVHGSPGWTRWPLVTETDVCGEFLARLRDSEMISIRIEVDPTVPSEVERAASTIFALLPAAGLTLDDVLPNRADVPRLDPPVEPAPPPFASTDPKTAGVEPIDAPQTTDVSFDWDTKSRRKPKNAKPGDTWRASTNDGEEFHVLSAVGEWLPAETPSAAAEMSAAIRSSVAAESPTAVGKSEPTPEAPADPLADLTGSAPAVEIPSDDDVKRAVASHVNEHGGESARACFAKFGATKLVEVKDEDRAKLVAALQGGAAT